jgi:hypothetical protein
METGKDIDLVARLDREVKKATSLVDPFAVDS